MENAAAWSELMNSEDNSNEYKSKQRGPEHVLVTWVGAIAEILPKRFVPQYALTLLFISVSACAQTSHKQYQFYSFDELRKAIGASSWGVLRTIPDGTHVAVHGIVRGNQVKAALAAAYRAKSQGVMVFYLYQSSSMTGPIKFTTPDIGLIEAMRKECEVAKEA